MLEGWFCRTMNEEARQQSALDSITGETDASEPLENENETTGPENESEPENSKKKVKKIDYKSMYSNLKKKVKNLIYDNMYYQHNLRVSQRRLLKVSRDRSFLLDRLLEYQQPELSSSDSDATDSSEGSSKLDTNPKKRKVEASATQSTAPTKPSTSQPKRTKKELKKPQPQQEQNEILLLPQDGMDEMMFAGSPFDQQPLMEGSYPLTLAMPHTPILGAQQAELQEPYYSTPCLEEDLSKETLLSKEDILKHLQSRRTMPEVVPEGELPTEMFNNNLFSESIDQLGETPPNGMLL